eukprot:2482882-Pleurochrysis_carterae.AAC.1
MARAVRSSLTRYSTSSCSSSARCRRSRRRGDWRSEMVTDGLPNSNRSTVAFATPRRVNE